MENSNFKRQLIIHHNADPDGWCSGALATKFFARQIDEGLTEIIGYNYEDKAPWMDQVASGEVDLLQFIDITPPVAWLKENNQAIIDGKINIVIFDHHKAKFDDITELACYTDSETFDYYYEDDRSAAKIYCEQLGLWAEEYSSRFKKLRLYVDDYVKQILDIVSLYDTWQFVDESIQEQRKVLSVQEFIRCYYSSAQKMFNMLFIEQPDIKGEVIEKGNVLCNYQIANARERISRGKQAVVGDYTVFVVEEPANFFVEEVLRNEYQKFDELDFIITYKLKLHNSDRLQKVKLSFRVADKENTELDCVPFIRENFDKSGGGHKQAGGASVSIDKLLEIIEN